jgi:stearoyl-CoA desaturase (delta-9 desaturase)
MVMGEHNHERHHLAERDYRVGTRWYHIDLGRWFIELCAWVNLAHDLRVIPEEEVVRAAARKSGT